MIRSVIEFNHDILGIEKRSLGPMPVAEMEHLIKSLHEEVDEFEEACSDGDFIKQIDSLLDGIYFALGGLYKMGLTAEMVDDIFAAIHAANLRKKKGVVARRDTGAPDAIKPDDWISPDERIARILDRHTAVGA